MKLKFALILFFLVTASFAEGPRNITSPQVLSGFTYKVHTTLWGVEDAEYIRRELTFGFSDRFEFGIVPWQLISANAKLFIWESTHSNFFIKHVGVAAFIGNNGLDLYDLMDDDESVASFWGGIAVSAEIGASPFRFELISSPNIERIAITKQTTNYVDSTDTVVEQNNSYSKHESYFTLPLGIMTEVGKRVSLIASLGYSPVWQIERGESISFYDHNFTATLGIHIRTPKEMRKRKLQRRAKRKRRRSAQ